MVGFIPHDQEQEINNPSKLKNSVDPAWCDKFELLDLFVPEIDDISLSVNGSFLDFDSIKDWIEEMQEPEVEKSSEKVEDPTMESAGLSKTEQPDVHTDSGNEVLGVEIGRKAETLLSLNSVVEEVFGKVSLVDQSELNRVDENGTKDDALVTEGLKDVNAESSSSGSESESSSAASSSSSSDDDDVVMDKGEKTRVIKEEGACGVKEDLEEGEIMQTGEERMDDEFDEDEAEEEDGSKDSFNAEILMDDGFDEDEDQTGGVLGPIKSKNELNVLPPVLPVDVILEPSHQMLPVGLVSSVLGAQVIVEGGEKHNPLSEGSILWITERRSPLGRVDEIFGPVKSPYYIVRYNSESEVPEGIHEGSLVSFVPEFVDHVLNNQNLYQKGYDASGENDEEVDEAEFSDDEKEAEYRKMMKMSKRGNNSDMKNKKSIKSFKRNNVQVESPARPPSDYSNRTGSSRLSPAFPGGPSANPRFPHQDHQPPGFEMPFHGNGFQMPWIQNQNLQQFPMRPPFQQPFNPAGPNPNNMNMGLPFSPLPIGNMVPNALNQVQFPMGLQAQLAQLSMLSGMLLAGQGNNNMQHVRPNLPQNADMLPPQFNQGPPNAAVLPPQFNQGSPNAAVLPPQFNQGAVTTHHGGRPQNADRAAPQFNQGPPNADVLPPQFNQGAVATHHGGRPQNADRAPPQFNQGAATHHGGRPQNADGAPPQFNQGAHHGGRSFQRRGGRGGRSRGRRGGQSFQSR